MLADIKWLFNFDSPKSYYENIDTFQLRVHKLIVADINLLKEL